MYSLFRNQPRDGATVKAHLKDLFLKTLDILLVFTNQRKLRFCFKIADSGSPQTTTPDSKGAKRIFIKFNVNF